MTSPIAAALAILLAAAPPPAPRDLRVVLDCRWAVKEHCEAAKAALDKALALEKVRVADRVERLERLKGSFCEEPCPPGPEASADALPTLWVALAYDDPELHVAFTLADGTVRSVLLLEKETFDRFREASSSSSSSSEGVVTDLVKATTGLWVVDMIRGAGSGGGGWGPITPAMMEKVWRSTIRSVVQHGFSKKPAQLGRKIARDARWEVKIEKVEVTPRDGVELTPVGEKLWTAVAEAAVGRRLPDVLDELEEVDPKLGEHLLGVEYVSSRNGTGTDGWSSVNRGPLPFADENEWFRWRVAVDGAHLMPRCWLLGVDVTLKATPRPRKK